MQIVVTHPNFDQERHSYPSLNSLILKKNHLVPSLVTCAQIGSGTNS